MNTQHNNWIDLGAIATFIATLIGWVPALLAPFTAIATFLWAVDRAWETKTVRAALERLKAWRSG